MTICLWTFGIPDGSQCVLGFAYNVIPTYCCIYVYIGGEVCAIYCSCCSLIGDLVMYVVVFFVLLLCSFQWLGWSGA